MKVIFKTEYQWYLIDLTGQELELLNDLQNRSERVERNYRGDDYVFERKPIGQQEFLFLEIQLPKLKHIVDAGPDESIYPVKTPEVLVEPVKTPEAIEPAPRGLSAIDPFFDDPF